MQTRVAGLLLFIGTLTHSAAGENWYESTFFNVHVDQQTHPGQADFGAGVDVAKIVKALSIAKPDFVQYHAKGHPGWATYPTKVGQAHPEMKGDVLRAWRDATRQLDIKLSVYYSGGVDHRVAQEHPEWCRRTADGQLQAPIAGPTASLCFNTPYVDRVVLPMIRELINDYDVDAVWFDGDNWSVLPCWCDDCTKAFTAETGKPMPTQGDEAHWPIFTKFHRDSFVRYLQRVADTVHHENPNCLFASNWAYTLRQPDDPPDFIDWLSGNVPPAHGPAAASLEARFLTTRNKPFDLTVWDQVYAWSDDPPQAKLPVHLMQESAIVISNGGRVFIWNTPRSDGSLKAAAHETIKEVADFVRARRKWCHQTESVPCVAILHSESHHYKYAGLFGTGDGLTPLRGAHAALTELHFHTDIINERTLLRDASRYHTLVIPEQRDLPSDVIDAIADYARSGGQLLLTGPVADTRLSAVLGIQTQNQPVLPNGFAAHTPHGPWIFQAIFDVRADGGTVLTEVHNADDPTQVTRRNGLAFLFQPGQGRAVYVATDIFREYAERRHPRIRMLIGEWMDRLVKDRRLRLDGPPNVEASLRAKDGHWIVNLINHAPGKDTVGHNNYIESVPPLFDINLELAMDHKPRKVFFYPDTESAGVDYQNGRLKVRLRRLDVHRSIVIQK